MQNKTSFSTFGVDLNEFKDQADFNILSNTVDFIYLRSSGSGTGSFRVDKKFLDYAKQCRNLKIPVGAYHFGVPSSNLLSADSQCDDFIEILKKGFGPNDYGDLFPVLDVEVPVEKSITTTQLVSWIQRFRKRFEKKTRRRLMLYTGLFFIQLYDNFKVLGKYPLSDMPLWIAMYKKVPQNPPIPPDIGGWTKWIIWQYSEDGNIKGVNPPVDLNWGPNKIEELKIPNDVTGVFAREDSKNIYISWNKNKESDIAGYNVFANANYIGTVGKNINYYVIPKSKFNLLTVKDIKIGVEAFDYLGDFSKNRGEYILRKSRGDGNIEDNSIYIMKDIIIIT